MWECCNLLNSAWNKFYVDAIVIFLKYVKKSSVWLQVPRHSQRKFSGVIKTKYSKDVRWNPAENRWKIDGISAVNRTSWRKIRNISPQATPRAQISGSGRPDYVWNPVSKFCMENSTRIQKLPSAGRQALGRRDCSAENVARKKTSKSTSTVNRRRGQRGQRDQRGRPRPRHQRAQDQEQ